MTSTSHHQSASSSYNDHPAVVVGGGATGPTTAGSGRANPGASDGTSASVTAMMSQLHRQHQQQQQQQQQHHQTQRLTYGGAAASSSSVAAAAAARMLDLGTQARMGQLFDEQDHKRCSVGNQKALLAESLDRLRGLVKALEADDWRYAPVSSSGGVTGTGGNGGGVMESYAFAPDGEMSSGPGGGTNW